MRRQLSIAEACDQLSDIVHEVERGGAVALTRQGTPVAVLLSLQVFERLTEPAPDFWSAIEKFRQEHNAEEAGFTREYFTDLRDRPAGREIEL